MLQIAIVLLVFSLCGCAGTSAKYACPGSVELPAEFAGLFVPAEDETLLSSAKGAPDIGSLCEGKVYMTGDAVTVTVYRAWNSTNPGSRLGKWWSFYQPKGKVAQYRSEYEICYQWSPLDKLTQCKIKAGTKIVVGTGQSAKCSEYLTYPPSAVKQIYVQNSSSVLSDCRDYDLFFSWAPLNK
jgi:hypothetical protein